MTRHCPYRLGSLAPGVNRPRLERTYKLSPSCLTSVAFVHQSLFVACSTDGHIYWLPLHGNDDNLSGGTSSRMIAKCALHGMDTVAIGNNRVAVTLGGDDGSVTVLALCRDEVPVPFSLGDGVAGRWRVDSLSRYPLAHAGSTVACRWLSVVGDTGEMLLASLGSDMRLLLWRAVLLPGDGLADAMALRCVSRRCVGVTDPHSMAVTADSVEKRRCWLAAVGMGAQLLPIDLRDV